jgi:hypothetical protein
VCTSGRAVRSTSPCHCAAPVVGCLRCCRRRRRRRRRRRACRCCCCSLPSFFCGFSCTAHHFCSYSNRRSYGWAVGVPVSTSSSSHRLHHHHHHHHHPRHHHQQQQQQQEPPEEQQGELRRRPHRHSRHWWRRRQWRPTCRSSCTVDPCPPPSARRKAGCARRADDGDQLGWVPAVRPTTATTHTHPRRPRFAAPR